MLLNVSSSEGLNFPGFGPLDQGALNKYYEGDLRKYVLPAVYNSKSYDSFNQDAKIVHFHGPKPMDFFNFEMSGECRFADLCNFGMSHGFISYCIEWTTYAPVTRQVFDLKAMCLNKLSS
jgi:hypothetical protein